VPLSSTPSSIAIPLLGNFSLNVLVPSDLVGEAKKFVAFVREQIWSCRS
jgi:hypothetical protein